MKTKWMAASLMAVGLAGAMHAHEMTEENQEKVQLALLLDTSNSMDGLIQQAKTQLWSIVNTFNGATKDDHELFVEVSLYEYGNASLDSESYWIREVLPFTRDLDKVSEQLFELRTNGGEEYCGAVIKRAIEQLKWDENPSTYKAMFIAGNEPFNQGGIDPGSACREAMGKGVIVNSIHCGSEQEGINGGWKSGALVTGGAYCVIDQNKTVVSIDCPQDKVIIELNGKLNGTYLRFGVQGDEAALRQQVQDQNALDLSTTACVSRALTKSSANYCNRAWDLVDACQVKDFDISSIADDQLPEEMRGKILEEKKAIVAKHEKERADIQKRIQELNTERTKWLEAELKRRGEKDGDTLGEGVREAIRKQAVESGIELGGC